MPKSTQTRVNTRYFKRLLEDRKLTQRELASRMHLDPAAISLGLSGRRKFTTRETSQLAQILEIPLDDVLINLSVEVPRAKQGGHVTVVGEVVQTGEVTFGRARGPRSVIAPPREAVEGLKAVVYMGAGALHGAHLYFRVAAGIAPDAIGKLCVCALVGGRTLLAMPTPGDRRETYTLADVAGNVIEAEAWLERASPIIWIKTP